MVSPSSFIAIATIVAAVIGGMASILAAFVSRRVFRQVRPSNGTTMAQMVEHLYEIHAEPERHPPVSIRLKR